MSANLILGASHAMVLARQVGRFEGDWKVAVRDLIPIATHSGAETWLLFSTNNPTFLELKPGAGGEIAGVFGPLMDKVRAFNRPGAKVVLGVGGNEHNIRFLAPTRSRSTSSIPSGRGLSRAARSSPGAR